MQNTSKRFGTNKIKHRALQNGTLKKLLILVNVSQSKKILKL